MENALSVDFMNNSTATIAIARKDSLETIKELVKSYAEKTRLLRTINAYVLPDS
jgi:hypothetical protein